MTPSETRGYRHVIFDFDGVICDSLSAAIDSLNHLRPQFPALPVVSTRDDMANVYLGSLQTALHRWLTPEESKQFFDRHSAEMERRSPSLTTFPGISRAIRRLRPKGASIVTSAYSEAVRTILSKDSDFDAEALYKIAGRELRQTKSAKILHLLSDLQLRPDQAVYVGDLQSDILYCRSVPIDIISVGYGYQPTALLSPLQPTHVAPTVADLDRLLAELYTPILPLSS